MTGVTPQQMAELLETMRKHEQAVDAARRECNLTPRQLTELAAAASGIHGEWTDELQGIIQRDSDGKRKPAPVWRPLEDVAQAWFLICQLHIDITWDLAEREVSAFIDWIQHSATEQFSDFEAGGKQALCLAVVRCAASMPPIAHRRQQPQQEE